MTVYSYVYYFIIKKTKMKYTKQKTNKNENLQTD